MSEATRLVVTDVAGRKAGFVVDTVTEVLRADSEEQTASVIEIAASSETLALIAQELQRAVSVFLV